MSLKLAEGPHLIPKKAKKKKKKKTMSPLLTMYCLPRIDEMVLFKPMTSSSTEPCVPGEESSRTASVREIFEKYNRWLALVKMARSMKEVRATAMDLQQSVHELNTFFAEMMMQVDREILDLQDKTEAFVESIQQSDEWQTDGDLLELTCEELDAVFSKHPRRNMEDHIQYLCKTVRRALNTRQGSLWCGSSFSSQRLPDKALMRLIKEIESCPNIAFEVFHLYILAKIHVVNRYIQRYPDSTILVHPQEVDEKVANVMRESRRKRSSGISNPRILFDFAEARRQICFPDPLGCHVRLCRRSLQLHLTEELQK
ncbi:hypothetical protein LTR37_014011 [Vermiconidia calcicola]|uniref:Uncharacterized protein n=1 Tax=Vermiconidia calcicola TaxID=1690605 RepID=A0ACC3MVL2_9PEZI|nr:hypothetical protein LTR37_014011 [Vermiconidia calcicola]